MNSGRLCITGNFFVAVFAFICVNMVVSCSGAQFEWKTAPPDSKGLSAEKLNNLKKSLAAGNTKALLVIRKDILFYILREYDRNNAWRTPAGNVVYWLLNRLRS